MVELRKRPAPAAADPPAAKKSGGAKKEGTLESIKKTAEKVVKSVTKPKAAQVGDVVDVATFGGEIETHEGSKVTLAKLLEQSKAGVVLFTYPKASTPGCTTQACGFRDSYEPLTSTGLSIFGLSTDSPKSNTTFKTKYNFPYTLLCDPKATLIEAIGLKKSPSGTQRGVFVIDKTGKVLVAEAGSPAGTVETVKKLVESQGTSSSGTAAPEEPNDKKAATVAAEVADTAAKVDA